MFAFLTKFLLIVRSRLRSQARLQAQILVLRQQVLVLSPKSLLRVGCGTSIADLRLALSVNPIDPGRDHRGQARQCSAGIVAAFEPIGTGSLGGPLADPRLIERSEP